MAQSQSGERILRILSILPPPPSRHRSPQHHRYITSYKQRRHQQEKNAVFFWCSFKVSAIRNIFELCWKNRCIGKFPHHVIETLPRYRRVIIIRSYISPHFSLNWVIKIISGKITLILKSNHFHQKIIPIYDSFCKTLSELIFFLPYATRLKSVEHQLLLASFTWICWN